MRTDEQSRTIEASPDAIYRAFLDREALLAWLPPRGMTARIDRFDARVGGGYRMVLTYTGEGTGKASEKEDIVDAVFVALDAEHHRVVQDVVFASDAPEFAGTMRMTWAAEAEGDRSKVTFRCENVPVGISQEDHEQGLTASLDNLAALLEVA
jgi:uncharacterized protein YndB with AHSA1/START domain